MDYRVDPAEPPAVALAAATSRCDGCSSCSYEPVQAMVDGDVLDNLFGDDQAFPRPGQRRLTIECEDCVVTMDDELITINQCSQDGTIHPDV